MSTEYLQYRASDFLSQILPRRFAYWIGLRVADAYYRKDTKGRQAVISNLRHILEFTGVQPSEEKLELMARKTFQLFGKYVVDFFRFSKMRKSTVRRIVSIEHGEYINQAMSIGKGVLTATAHLGSWEIGGAVMAALDYPINVVVLEQQDQKVNALFQKRRESRGVRVIPLGSAVSGILKALKKCEIIGMMADRDFGKRSHPMRFFGAMASIPRGPAALSVRTGAPVLPGFLLRQEDDTFLFRFHPPIIPEQNASVDDIQAKICAVLEQEIGENPTQWFIFEEFWKDKE